MIVGTNDLGMYYSEDDGQTWFQSNSGLENSTIASNRNNIRLSTIKNDTIFIVSFNGEVFRQKISDLSPSSTGTGTVIRDGKRFSLLPNPAHTSITLSTESLSATATITDMSGRTVRRLSLSSSQTAIDIADLRSGMYVLHFSDEKSTGTVRFVKE